MASDPTPIRDAQAMEDARAKVAEKELEHLKGGGGGGTFDGMEPRIAKLEAQMEAARSDLGDLKSRAETASKDLSDIKTALARIEAELRHRVDYKWLTVYVLGIAALILREEIAALFR